jgi:hypothetical protein
MSGTLAPMTMNADEALINAVYCQVQCLGCTDWRSDRVKAAIGKFYLAKPGVRESCRPVARSVVAQVLQEVAGQTSITYLIEPARYRAMR